MKTKIRTIEYNELKQIKDFCAEKIPYWNSFNVQWNATGNDSEKEKEIIKSLKSDLETLKKYAQTLNETNHSNINEEITTVAKTLEGITLNYIGMISAFTIDSIDREELFDSENDKYLRNVFESAVLNLNHALIKIYPTPASLKNNLSILQSMCVEESNYWKQVLDSKDKIEKRSLISKFSELKNKTKNIEFAVNQAYAHYPTSGVANKDLNHLMRTANSLSGTGYVLSMEAEKSTLDGILPVELVRQLNIPEKYFALASQIGQILPQLK